MRFVILIGVLFMSLFLNFSISANASESGVNNKISLNDAYLQFTGHVAEEAQGGLISPQWKLGAQSRLAEDLDLSAVVGASSLLYKPRWTAPTSNDVSLLEAKGFLKTSFVDFYAGQFLVPWGLEGSREENELFFPRSLLYEHGLLPLRDYGAGISADSEGFYFNIAAHGGGASGGGNEVFVTGQWGWQSPTREALGVSATEGRFLDPVTSLNTKLRALNMFFKFHFFNLVTELEGSYFEDLNSLVETDYVAWHCDLIYPASEAVDVLGRYEQYNPNIKINSNVLGRGTFGIGWHNKNSTSRLFVYLVKNNESLQEVPNDEIQLAWRITD